MSSVHMEFAQFGDFDSFDVFRSDSPINTSSLPTPIATGLLTMYYEDDTVINGMTYYYMVRVNRAGESLLSEEIAVSTTVSGADDIYFSNVVSLIHFDNYDNDGNIKDEIGLVSWRSNGALTTLTSDQVKFGTKSLYINNVTTSGSNGSYITTISPTDIFSFGATDSFTLEFFFMKTSINGNACMVAFNNAAGGGRWAFFCRSGDVIKPAIYDGATFIDQTTQIPLNTWVHFAFSKDGLDNYLFLNGKRMQMTTKATTGYAQANITIGNNGILNETFTGYVDELRITKGVARYISEFIPPSAPF